MKKLLLAASRKSGPIALEAVEGYFETIVCTSLKEAKLALTKDIDIVLCGLHFDEGRLLEFLRFAKGNADTSSIPFVCVKATEDILSPVMIESIEIASKSLGAESFIDFHEWQTTMGDEKSFQKLRDHINDVMRHGPI